MPIDTICRDCVFAEWEGAKQSGCQFDRLEKFEDGGAMVLLEESEGKTYAHIVGRVCNTCRHSDTLKDIPARKWMNSVRKEVIPRVAIAVYVEKSDDDQGFIDAVDSLIAIHRQTIKPHEIILIYNCLLEGHEAPPEYAAWFNRYVEDIPWRIQAVKGVLPPLPSIHETLDIADYGRSIDLAVQSDEMTAIYFAVCKAGYEFPLDFVETIDYAINEALVRFVALLPDEVGNGMFVQKNLHNFLQGNKKVQGCDSIIDKIREIAQEEGTGHMIKRFDDLKKLVE